MSLGISDLAHSLRKNSAAAAVPVPLGHAQQLIAAALGYRTFAAYQAAQATTQEPASLTDVHHVVLDEDLLDQRASELGAAPPPDRLHELIETAFRERAPHTRIHASYAAFENYLRQHVDQVEPPRELRRLQRLRRWSHDKVKQVLTRGPRARRAHGAGAPRRLPLAVVSH